MSKGRDTGVDAMGAELHLELRSNNAASAYPLNLDIEFGRNGVVLVHCEIQRKLLSVSWVSSRLQGAG